MRGMRVSIPIIGPGRPTRTFALYVHFAAIKRRCQRIKVSGVTIVATWFSVRLPKTLALAANRRR